MTAWTESPFLQALGWATLNSLWQMALLWAVFSFTNHFFRLSANRKYQASVGAILLGFVWFITTALVYYQNQASSYTFFQNTILHSNSLLHICLLSASVTYLLLLVFPAIRLFRNWRFVQRIKTEGQQKAPLEYRFYVQKVSFLLGIKKKVKVVVSTFVNSPLTVGYLKPVILLPVAAMNNLSTAQVEAILLHELSHIRRYDYILNFVVSVIHTLLYFNPFVKSFINVIEAEREACCDEVVLQFGYDKVGYASALLHLEKSGGRQHTLELAAAGKKYLLTRIEKIVGMEKKQTFKLVQIVPLFLSMLCVFLFNSVLIIKDAGNGEGIAYTNDMVFTPLPLNSSGASKQPFSAPVEEPLKTATSFKMETATINEIFNDEYNIYKVADQQPLPAEYNNPVMEHFMPVDFDEVDGSLTKEEKEKVKTTVEATKKVAGTMQWKEIEIAIADAMNQQEKAIAHQEYLHELNKVNWSNVEQNMKANYDKLDWEAIDATIARAMTKVELDSMQTVIEKALTELDKAEKNLKAKAKCTPNAVPMPDASVAHIQLAKETLQKNLEELKAASKPKKSVCL